MIIVTGSVIIRPAELTRALGTGIAHSVRSRGEPGCLGHNCHIDAENAHRLVFVEYWQDMAALQAHFAVPASSEFVREMSSLSDSAPEIRLFQSEQIPM